MQAGLISAPPFLSGLPAGKPDRKGTTASLLQRPARRNVLKTGGVWRILDSKSRTKGETAI